MRAAAGPRLPLGWINRACCRSSLLRAEDFHHPQQQRLDLEPNRFELADEFACHGRMRIVFVVHVEPTRKLASSLGAVRYLLSARASTKELVALLNAVRRGGRGCNTRSSHRARVV
jgi:hypothetical protein